jgi:hypothetical protein
MRLFTLSGCKRSGKDTCFEIMRTEWESKGYTVAKFAFADALREVCAIVFGYTDEHFQDDLYKESFPSPVLGSDWTPRLALQFVGTELFRAQVDVDVWVRVGIQRVRALMSQFDVVVVTDARFENELRALKELGSLIVFVARPSHMPRVCTHASERFVQELEENFVQIRDSDPALFLKGTLFDFVLFNEDLSVFTECVVRTFSDPGRHPFGTYGSGQSS